MAELFTAADNSGLNGDKEAQQVSPLFVWESMWNLQILLIK